VYQRIHHSFKKSNQNDKKKWTGQGRKRRIVDKVAIAHELCEAFFVWSFLVGGGDGHFQVRNGI
jgi:hypothetical protein